MFVSVLEITKAADIYAIEAILDSRVPPGGTSIELKLNGGVLDRYLTGPTRALACTRK